MSDTSKSILSLVATTSQRVRELPIKNSQLIFIQDVGRIAFDFKGKRVFYNQIIEIDKEENRQKLDNPFDGYYFVVDTAILWRYNNGWIQITGAPQEVLFVGVELPTLGQANKLYANITDGAESISVWDAKLGKYVIVADKTHFITTDEVVALFN